MRKLYPHWVLLALLLLSPSALQGQRGAPTGNNNRVPAAVVLVDSLPQQGAPFVIVRRVDVAPGDVILLRTGATAEHLSDAVRALMMVRQVSGDSATTARTMRVRPRQGAAQNRPVLPWAPRVIADVSRAQVENIPGVGPGRAVTIWLPRQRKVAPLP
jgi:hypothetical protein